jgi:hypothetical protein
VFGDDRCWYIVIKGCNDNKVYVIEGLTGRLRNTITANEDSKVIDVSCQGHIVITRTWKRPESEGTSTFTDKNGNTLERMNWETNHVELFSLYLKPRDAITRTWESVESEGTSTFTDKDGNTLERMNWEINRVEFPSSLKLGDVRSLEERLETTSKQYDTFTYREMLLYHYERAQESIPIYPLAEKLCHCSLYVASDYVSEYEAAKFSQDGRLLAYHYKDSIFVVNTSDGSLFKRCSFANPIVLGIGGVEFSTLHLTILFVSERYIIMHRRSVLFVFNVQTNDIEHSICLSRYFYKPTFLKGVGEPFTLLYNADCGNVSHVVFHNLEFKLW